MINNVAKFFNILAINFVLPIYFDGSAKLKKKLLFQYIKNLIPKIFTSKDVV